MLKALIAIGIGVAIVAVVLFLIPSSMLPQGIQALRGDMKNDVVGDMPLCNQANYAVRIGDKVCRYENSEYVWKTETGTHYAGEPLPDNPHYMYTGTRTYDGTWSYTCIPGEWMENNKRYVCSENHRITIYNLDSQEAQITIRTAMIDAKNSGKPDSSSIEVVNEGMNSDTIIAIGAVNFGTIHANEISPNPAIIPASGSEVITFDAGDFNVSASDAGKTFVVTIRTESGQTSNLMTVLQ